MFALVRDRIHETAMIGGHPAFGQRVTIGAHTVVYANVTLGDDVVIGPGCIIGEPVNEFYRTAGRIGEALSIGAGSIIRPGTVIYAGSVIGDHFECGHHVVIHGQSTLADHCYVGTGSEIQAASSLGRYCRIQSGVLLGQNTRLGDFVWIYPQAVLGDDPHPPTENLPGVTVEDYAVIAARAVVMAGVTIGRHAFVSTLSLVDEDVPPEAVMIGNPAQQVASIHDITDQSADAPVYPWPEHFDRGMPWQGMEYARWLESQGKK